MKFNSDSDELLFITGILAQTIVNHVRPIFEFARNSNDLNDFNEKLKTSKNKLEKFEVIKAILERYGRNVTDEKI
jgi:hypothetical protein